SPSSFTRFISRRICRTLNPATSAACFWLIFPSKACPIRWSRLISRGFILSRSSPSTLSPFQKNQQGRLLHEDISTLVKADIIILGRQVRFVLCRFVLYSISPATLRGAPTPLCRV